MLKKFAFFGLALIFLGGCAATNQNTLSKWSHARPITNETATTKELRSLPLPKDKIPVAIWSFPDETGRNLRSTNAATELSKAVTQGAVHMLITEALHSKWFTVIDGQSSKEIITELEIMTKKDAVPKDQGFKNVIKPRYLVTGAITGYQDSVISGGLGGGLRGLNLSGREKIALIEVDIRFVEIETRSTVLSVNLTKRILSEELDFGIFRFIKINKLLEFEAGLSTNEPTQICVRETIQKALINLIAEGVRQGLWPLANPEEKKFFTNYVDESSDIILTDADKAKLEKSKKIIDLKIGS